MTDLESRPIAGFTFDDCVPFRRGDAMRWRVEWRQNRLGDLQGRAVRLEMRCRNTGVHAVRGKFHFSDARDQDSDFPSDGRAIGTRWFDYWPSNS